MPRDAKAFNGPLPSHSLVQLLLFFVLVPPKAYSATFIVAEMTDLMLRGREKYRLLYEHYIHRAKPDRPVGELVAKYGVASSLLPHDVY